MDVSAWLSELGLQQYHDAFRDNDVDAEVLIELSETDLERLGVASLGHRKKLLKAIERLRVPVTSEGTAVARSQGEPPPAADAGPGARREAERRQLTLLFCDLVGSTEMSARLDPEDMGRVISAYQECCAKIVRRWDGHVAKYMGDGMLSYFGYPRAHEDDAERAVRAGLELTEGVARLKPKADVDLRARVGIATGLVMVGDLIGEGAAQEQAVVGETPNLAARLERLAEPGAVVVASGTQRLLGGLFDLADLGQHQLKGFEAPVQAWRVAGESSAEGRFEARQGGSFTPLVGREHELGLLLGRWGQARDGDGQVVLLSGEAGIGKSRMLEALRERLGDEPHIRLRYFCSPYHLNSAFYPILQQIERAAIFARDDSAQAKHDKLEAVLAQGTNRVGEAVALVASLMSIPTGERYPPLNLSPQRRKSMAQELFLEQLNGLAARQPVLMLLEDAHWIDPTTLEQFDLAIDRIQRLPVLLVITFRPEFAQPWGRFPHITSFSLNRLSYRQSAAMIEQITGAGALPAEVLDQIVEKADGIPLFVEELTKTVLESDLLEAAGDGYRLRRPLTTLAIPSTLHDSLMARLDRLAPVKEVAQIGAVIGREFSHELLAAASSLPEAELDEALTHLSAAELIFRRGVSPQVVYAFKHALVQDAAYASLLRGRRQQLHAQIAEVLEQRFPESAEQQPEVLARHLSEAGFAERATAYYERAGHLAVSRSASKEAVAHFGKALEQLRTLPKTPERTRRETALLTAQAGALVNVTGLASDDLERTYIEARDLCEELGDSHQQFVVEWGLWHIYLGRAEYRRACEHADLLVAQAEREHDSGLRLQALHADWSSKWWPGDFAQTLEACERGWAMYDREAHSDLSFVYGGHDAGVCSRNIGSLVMFVLGYPDQARDCYEAGLALARELEHPLIVAHALNWGMPLFQLLGDADRLRVHAAEAHDLTYEQGLANYHTDVSIVRGWLTARDGSASEAVAVMEEALATRRARGTLFVQPYYLALLAEAHASNGADREALGVIEEAMECVRGTDERWIEPELHRVCGELLLAAGQRDDGEASLVRAIESARSLGSRSWELRAATSLARLRAEQGRRAEAQDLLAPVYGWFTEGFATKDVLAAKVLLGEL